MPEPGFIEARWPAPANVVAGTTTRAGGASRGVYAGFNLGAHVADDPAAVAANRRRLAAAVDLPSEPGWLQQVHGRTVVELPSSAPGTEADASWTGIAGEVCVVLTADCLPVLFCADDGSVVAAAHAGWRGLCAGVLEATVSALPVAADRLLAWLGPAIAVDAFEVGSEVREAFCAVDAAAERCFRPNERGRWQADLYALARQRLASVGLERVSGGDYCTFNDENRFYSYRRDGQTGRMASLIFRR